MKKLKTIKLQGKDYVQVNERLQYFNDTYKNGKIFTKPSMVEDAVYFKAVVTPDVDKPERTFTGHSFGNIKKEKALEKLETVAVGRALAFMGIGIVDSIASADEMQNFQNNISEPKIGVCDVCGTQGISGRYGAYCPNYKKHKEEGRKYKLIFPDELKGNAKKFADSLK